MYNSINGISIYKYIKLISGYIGINKSKTSVNAPIYK